MVIMESYYNQDHIRELWLKIDQLHLSYLEMEESSEKIDQRTKLEDCITEFLLVVPQKHKFVLSETEEVLYRSAAYKKDFSGYKAATGWNALQMYAGNLLAQPWRKEYRHIKTYCGFFKHQIEANLNGAEKMFEIMGYKPIGNGILSLDGPVCPDRVTSVSRDCLVAYVECQILKHMWEEAAAVSNVSWLEILESRRISKENKFHSNHVQEPIRNTRVDVYEKKYHPTSPTSQISVPINHNFVPTPSHNHVGVSLPTVPYCMPLTNGYPNAFATYAPCTAHMPIVKQPLSAVVTPNGYYYTNGFPMFPPGYPVPTGQLIEIESQNGYDMVDGASTGSRVRKSRTESNAVQENDRANRTDDLPKNGLGIREEEKQDSGEDWDYVYRNLERQGYSKDLGERGDVLALSVSDKQRKHSKETKKVKATNLDEEINNLSINNRPLKMTEALEKMEQKSAEKISQPKERRHSQGSTYENVTNNEPQKIVKPSVKITPNIGTLTKLQPKEKTEKDTSKGSTNVDIKKLKDKEKEIPSKWECKSCTYLNVYANEICEICSKSRNIGREQHMEIGGAECSQCTLVNPKSAKTCQACGKSLKDSPTYI